MKRICRSISSLLLLLILAGCVPAPRKGDGRLTIRVIWRNERSGRRGLEEIKAVTAYLVRQSLKITATLEMDGTGGGAAGSFEDLYPGEWEVRVDAAAADGTVLYTGRTRVTIVSGEEHSVSLTLVPNAGRLDFSMDIAPLLAGGLEIDAGRIYIYDDPAGGSSRSEDLTREGNLLRGVVEGLPTRTYEAKAAIPNTSDADFTTAFFRFSILPGRTATVFLTAEGSVDLTIGILPEPAQVAGLRVTVEEGRAVLSWQAVEEAAGYRIYRTDEDGRFKELALIEAAAATYVDETLLQAPLYGGAVGYAVAALAGEMEGLRSEPVWVAR